MAGTSINAASGIVLEPLTKDNYDNWSTLVKNYLIGERLWRVVTSVSQIGVETKGVSEIWKMKNAKALHIIQLACGSEILNQIRDAKTAKEAWNRLGGLYSSKLKADPDIEQGVVDDSLLHNKALHRYVENDEWNDAKAFINQDNTAIFSTSSSGRTVLHVAVIAGQECIVENLVKEGKDKLVKMQDNCGYTALALAADLTGNTKIAKCMVEKCRGGMDLLTMATKEGEIPVLLAAAKGHKEITRYLYSQTLLDSFVDKNSHNGILLLTRCITAEIFGRLYGLVLNFPPVKLLGRLLIFAFLLLQNTIFLKLSEIREIYDQKMTHHLVLEILNCLCIRISEYKESQLREASAYDAILQAAKLGVIEFLDAMRKANPDLLWAIDKNKRGIFPHAILNRRKNVFKLIDSVNGRKEIIKCRADAFGNTLLHLAGYLGPSSDLDRRSGAALQMQREIQWFKAVERIVHPQCKETKNGDGKKPREIFSESHEEMVKAGEKWAKDTAKSFTLVGTLITTIMFAAAFTVPGGNNQTTGIPIFVDNKVFSLFIIADTISLFTSSTSVLLFIGILTSRYAEKDFLKTLPLKLLFGLIALFLSVVSMMVAFCAAIAMMLKGYQRVVIAAMSLGSIPVLVLVPSQLRLFLESFNSTIRSN